jgi:hypothetical protein
MGESQAGYAVGADKHSNGVGALVVLTRGSEERPLLLDFNLLHGVILGGPGHRSPVARSA